MLADQLLVPTREWDLMGDGLRNWQGVLAKAEKFAIDRDLAEVIDDMPRRDIGLAMPFCRLPFPICWIEVAHLDRPQFARVTIAPGHYCPVRVGILCEQDGDDPAKFFATLAWSYKDADAKAQGMDHAFNVCPAGVYIDTTKEQDWIPRPDQGGEPFHAPFWLDFIPAPYWSNVIDALNTEGLQTVFKNAENDWQGEPWFWLGALALLNAKNGVASEPRPADAALNKSRAKAGKPPLVDYHQLTLRVGPREAREARERHGRGDPMRAHTVRGHFKVRKTGIYWWRAFMRGDVAGAGFAGKRYKVKL